MNICDKKKFFITLSLALVSALSFGQTPEAWKALGQSVNLILANDLGRNGYYDQKPIAELMGKMAEKVGVECVVAAGDIHHFEGVQSINDPLWMTNYEMVYSHPELMIPWYPILGNHEYRGNTQAVLDYSGVSARWVMPDRYYTTVLEKDGITVRLVMLDTTPLIGKYRNKSDKYPDACGQDADKQLTWIDSVLASAREDWVLVVGHHPIHADTSKDESERTDLQTCLEPILREHKVDMYLCGHIHNFQHIRKSGSDIDYVVNTSASLSRKEVEAIDGTMFCSGESGFSLIAADKEILNLHMVDRNGLVIYTVTRNRQPR